VTKTIPFALGTFRADDGGPFAGLVIGERVLSLQLRLDGEPTVRSLLDDWDASFAALEQLVRDAGPDAADHALAGLHPLPPVTPCGQIFQAGANYRTHVLGLLDGAAHRGDASDGIVNGDREVARTALDERAASGNPFVFQGSAHAMVGARDDVVLPPEHDQYDWELELVAVIGRRARRVPREQALDVVAGYTICNDITTRDALARPDVPGGIDWLAGKNSPTFLPTGPVVVPAAFAGDPMDLRVQLKVNGRVMQDESTADMIFDVARLIEYLSHVTELRPGDLVLTGSPAGNGAAHGVFLRDGDVMEGSVTGLGVQRNRCVAERVPAPDVEAVAR
jgi:2-keto-4-pentenoate hydratase/2-oxohepta-3-ene-1,7-dioic acid hydratase in catechol pathway